MPPADFDFDSTDACISFLPLSHITARALDYVMYTSGAQVAYCSKFDKLPQAMREVRPTVFVGVPRVYEKIRQEVERRAALSPVKKRMLAWALGVGAKHRDTVYDGRQPSSTLWKLANKLAYSKVREAFGGRVEDLCLRRRAAGHRHRAMVRLGGHRALGGLRADGDLAGDCPQHASHAIAWARWACRMPNLELKLAEDGELLVRGPSVFSGYWQQAGATAECFDDEGWFRTGDIAISTRTASSTSPTARRNC